jgi:hypothetical protein
VSERVSSWEARRRRMLRRGYNANGAGTPLGIAVRLPTPLASDSEKWTRGAESHNRGGGIRLPQAVRMMPTPRASYGGKDTARRRRPGSGGDDLYTRVVDEAPSGGVLNPTWVEWLMGFPLGWTVLAPSEIRSYRRSRRRSGGRSFGLKRGGEL